MVHGGVRTLFKLIGALVVVVLVAATLLAVRLSAGPLALDALVPYVEEALAAPDGSLRVRLESTGLAWQAGSGLDIRARGVHVLARDHTTLAAIPEMAVRLSAAGLLRGVLAPTAIELVGPRFKVVRRADGGMEFGLGDDVGAAAGGAMEPLANRLLDQLGGRAAADDPLSLLREVAVRDGAVEVDDRQLGANWRLRDAELRLSRRTGEVGGRLSMGLELAGTTTRMTADMAWRGAESRLTAKIAVDGLRPAPLARLGEPLAPLAGLDLPLSGRVDLAWRGGDGLERARFELAGEAGTVRLPAGVYPVRHVAGSGEWSAAGHRLALDHVAVDLGGPLLTASAVLEGLGGPMTMTAEATAQRVPVDSLAQLWPAEMGGKARRWVVTNLSKGQVPEAHLKVTGHLAAGAPASDLALDTLAGDMAPEGVTVRYLDPMPAVQGAAAAITFDRKTFRIDLTGGAVTGLKIEGGRVDLVDYLGDRPRAEIALKITGPLADALRLIDSKPLEYARALGLRPADVQGSGVTDLRLGFPLLANLRLDDVAVKAKSALTGVTLPKVLMDLDLREGALALDVDAKGMTVTGGMLLDTIPARLAWRENFSAEAPFRSRYQLSGRLDDRQRARLGLDGPVFQPPFLTGPVVAEVTATTARGGGGDLDAHLDLAGAVLELPGLGWRKPAGQPGHAEVTGRLGEHLALAAVPSFTVAGPDLAVQGSVAFDDGRASAVELKRLHYGRTEASGRIGLGGGRGLDIEVAGSSFDAAPLLASDTPEQRRAARAKRDRHPAMTVRAAFDRVWLEDGDGHLDQVRAGLASDGDTWREMRLDALVGEAKPFHLEVMPDGAGRSVAVSAPDAGAALRAFGLFDNIIGGQLTVTGRIDDSRPEQPMHGTAAITAYHVERAPLLARLLSVAALTGVVDVLGGQGIGFSALEVPFTLVDGQFDLLEARAWGSSLGLTAKGRIDLDRKALALEGTIVPAYVVNSVLGNLPLIGTLLTGEKGGGVIAFNYTMKGPIDDPAVTVNPLSALTPGFLRRLFDVFDAPPPAGGP